MRAYYISYNLVLNLPYRATTNTYKLRFHALRRQMKRDFRKPLINFSPKANLRYPGSFSLVSEFTNGGFREVIDVFNFQKAEVRADLARQF